MDTSDSRETHAGTRLIFGSDMFTFGTDVEELADSSGLLGNIHALRDRMADDGYLFIRGFFDREMVLRARLRVLRHLAKDHLLRPGIPVEAGVASEKNRSVGLFRNLEIAHSPEVLAVVDGPRIRDFFSAFLGGEIITFDKRWLRAMARGGSNGWHYDSVFMNRGAANLYTCWTPLGDVPLTDGPLALLLGSHRLDRVKETYGAIDIDRDHLDPLFTSDTRDMLDRFGCRLATAHYRAGDLLAFGLHMMHASVPNNSDRYRISIDTRYQLDSDPVDERFMGENGGWLGNYSFGNPAPRTPMSTLRAQWGLD